VVLLLFTNGLFTSSADSLYPDKRINQGHHLGGGVVYCQDENGIAYNGGFDRGRIVVLQWNEATQSASEAMEASLELVNSVGVPADPPGEAFIAAGGGYELWRLSSGEFQLRGNDEHGKPFLFNWSQCNPVIRDPAPPLGPDTGPSCPPPFRIIQGSCLLPL
jgi:hypothetical protein